jgi:hypothetical protein
VRSCAGGASLAIYFTDLFAIKNGGGGDAGCLYCPCYGWVGSCDGVQYNRGGNDAFVLATSTSLTTLDGKTWDKVGAGETLESTQNVIQQSRTLTYELGASNRLLRQVPLGAYGSTARTVHTISSRITLHFDRLP